MAAAGGLSLASFLHTGINRIEAERLLLDAKDDGCFLIRESESVMGAYTLCIMFQGRVHQYRVLPDENKKLFVQAEKGVQQRRFTDLLQLVHEYLHRGDNNGLACGLRHPVPPKALSDEPIDKDDSDEEVVGQQGDYAEVMTHDSLSNNSSNSLHTDTQNYLSRHMHERFARLDLSNFDGGFVNDLRGYVEAGVQEDSASALKNGESLSNLRLVLAKSAKDLERQLELFLAKIDTLRQIFGPTTTPPLVSPDKLMQKGKHHEVQIPALLDRLNVCRNAVTNLEKKAIKKLEELDEVPANTPVAEEKEDHIPNIPRRRSEAVQKIIPPTAFAAKHVKHGKNSKVKLTVDIQSGKLLIVKPTKDVLDTSNVFPHNKVEQLIKNTTKKTCLDIKIEGRKKETYIFESVKDRENFCQLMQQLKNLHSVTQEVDNISIFIGTWNMGFEGPPASLGLWLKSQGLGKTRCPTVSLISHDLYVIGTQESALNEKEWTNRLKSALYENFSVDMHTVAVVSLWSIRIVILVKSEYRHKISSVQHSSVKTGIANALGNKGAVGVSFNFNGTSLCFINAHLTSGNENNTRRNQNFYDIIKGLNLGPKGRTVFDITNRFHHLFFLGDLNYRIDGLDAVEVIKTITVEKNYSSLLEYDQLNINIRDRQAFSGFSEDEITFPPTYRIERDTRDKYIWQKQKKTWVRINCPSWCDRVLWRSYPDTYIRNISYGCVEDIMTSDHKPVFSAFDLGIMTQYASSKCSKSESDGDIKIIFTEIKVEVLTSCREHFFVEFHSPCLEDVVKTEQNKTFGPYRHGVCLPMWRASEIKEMKPIIDDRGYLEDQHIHLAIKSSDGIDSYGECVLALKSMFGMKPHKFISPLMHLGMETGKICGSMHVKTREGSSAGLDSHRVRRSYELVYMDTDTLWAIERERGDSFSGGTSLSRPMASSAVNKDSSVNTHPSLRQTSSNPLSDATYSEPTWPHSATCGNGAGAISKKPQNPRKPRLGQSSLGQNRGQNPSGSCAPRMQIKTLDKSSSSPAQNAESAVPAASVVRDEAVQENPRHPVPMRENVAVGEEKRVYSTLDEMRKNKRDSMRKESSKSKEDDDYSEPPTPPPRMYQTPESPETEYAALRKPSSINEWLLNLGLPEYIPLFIDQGWDHIDFISDITIKDLESIGITKVEHRIRIFKSVQDLKDCV